MQSNTSILRRDLMIRMMQVLMHHKPLSMLDHIPVEMTPRDSESAIRCCIYRERAVTRSGMISLLGFDNSLDDEVRPLSDYAREAVASSAKPTLHLTVLQEGCSHCIRTNYVVTNACRGCVARPCFTNCPKKAISFVNGQAKINEDLCVNCGLCMKVCPFHAITYVPVPCEDACPVGAIGKDETGKVSIDATKCIQCGKCKVACPFGAIFETSQLVKVVQALHEENPVIAMIAPAIAGQFPVAYGKLVAGIKKLGFSHVAEVAFGADCTAAAEASEWRENQQKGEPFLTSSCCPAYQLLVEKHIPALRPYVSTTSSPMVFTAQTVKAAHPTARTVFIGPCLAKKQEAAQNSDIDFVISFEELGAMLAAMNIQLQSMDEEVADLLGSKGGCGFALSGGVTAALADGVTSSHLVAQQINGITTKSITQLKLYAQGKGTANFVEVMACEGGCIAGPNSLNGTNLATRFIKKHLETL